MRAIDTNVIVRLLVRDDEDQAKRAFAVIEAGEVFVPTTVILETEWVIRRLYGFGPGQAEAALRDFSGLPGVTLENPAIVDQALDGMQGGTDFADALHLAAAVAETCTAFLTFDRRLVKAAASHSSVRVEEP